MQPRSLGLPPGRDGAVFHVTKRGLSNEGHIVKRPSQTCNTKGWPQRLVQSRILEWRLDMLLVVQPGTQDVKAVEGVFWHAHL